MAVKTVLEKAPEPRQKMRVFHGRRLPVWEGVVRIDAIEGWVDNPRIRLASQRKKTQVGNRPLTQDEVFEIMKADSEFSLAELRDDILENGLREPLVLSAAGRLLDGNRRFFAIRFVLESLDKGHPDRQDYERVHAYVLDDSCSQADEALVLVEENFHKSLKCEWPDYVKAMFIKEDWESGLDHANIGKKYSWPKRKVVETIRILQVIDDFLAFATGPKDPHDENGGGLGLSEIEAETIAAANYQFFNEAQKSFYQAIQTDAVFKVVFFRWIAENKFSSFPEVRIAYDAWTDAEARDVIQSDKPTAAKDAKAVIDYRRRIVKSKDNAQIRVDEFIKFLESLSGPEMRALSETTLKRLKHAMQLVTDCANTAKKVPPTQK